MKTFIFDFDSTVFPGETLDEIIQYQLKDDPNSKEKNAEITSICNQGMSGEITMEESLKKRLEIASPDKETIAQYVKENAHRIDPTIVSLLTLIQESEHNLYIVSGGFEEWIKPLLDGVVAAENIHANKIIDIEQPMFYNNIIQRDKETIIGTFIEGSETGKSNIYIIGDGATDFSVYEHGIADHFIGSFFYTGVDIRKRIFEKIKEKKQRSFDNLKEFIDYMKEVLNN